MYKLSEVLLYLEVQSSRLCITSFSWVLLQYNNLEGIAMLYLVFMRSYREIRAEMSVL